VSTGLGTCEQTLAQTNISLFTLRGELNSTTSDIRKYDTLYEQKAGELEQKKTELTSTQAELNRVTLQKEVYKKQIDEAYASIINLNRTITSLNVRVNSLTNQLEDANDVVSCLKNTADAQENAVCLD
jgi:chromosome segregation ATPase